MLTFEAIRLPLLIPLSPVFLMLLYFSLEIMLCLLLDSSKIYFSLALLCLVPLRGLVETELAHQICFPLFLGAQRDHISQIPLQLLVAMCLRSFQ